MQVIGSSLADTVSASYDAGVDSTVSLNMQGVETFDIALVDDAAQLRVDMALVTGLTRINVSDASSEDVEFYNFDNTGVTIDAFTTHTTGTAVEVVLADATGSLFSDFHRWLMCWHNVNLTAAWTINISSDTVTRFDLSGISMTAASTYNTVNFTGTNDIG